MTLIADDTTADPGDERENIDDTDEMATPAVTIDADMPPELVADVAAQLAKLGVEVRSVEPAPVVNEAKVIVVVSPKGGSGKTAVASNLSVALSEQHPGRVVAVDLDVQFGNLEMALGLTVENTLAQLARTGRIDQTSLKLHLTPAAHDLFVLIGASDPVDADSIDHTHVEKALELLRQSFEYIIVDTAAGLDERTLSALDCATDVLLVSSLDVASIRSLRTANDALDHLGLNARRQLLLNRADSKVGLEPSDAEEVMGMPISVSVPSSREIPLSLNLGKPVVVDEPKLPVARQFRRLAEVYSPAAKQPTPRKRWFG